MQYSVWQNRGESISLHPAEGKAVWREGTDIPCGCPEAQGSQSLG